MTSITLSSPLFGLGQIITKFKHIDRLYGSGIICKFENSIGQTSYYVLTCAHIFAQMDGKSVFRFPSTIDFHYNQISKDQCDGIFKVDDFQIYDKFLREMDPKKGFDIALGRLKGPLYNLSTTCLA